MWRVGRDVLWFLIPPRTLPHTYLHLLLNPNTFFHTPMPFSSPSPHPHSPHTFFHISLHINYIPTYLPSPHAHPIHCPTYLHFYTPPHLPSPSPTPQHTSTQTLHTLPLLCHTSPTHFFTPFTSHLTSLLTFPTPQHTSLHPNTLSHSSPTLPLKNCLLLAAETLHQQICFNFESL